MVAKSNLSLKQPSMALRVKALDSIESLEIYKGNFNEIAILRKK